MTPSQPPNPPTEFAAPPDLDALCSQHFRWRQLIECGETWHRLARSPTPVANVPQQPETWTGIHQLAVQILDPLVDRFGRVELTYGFAGPGLTKHIRHRIAPALDQHAGAERNAKGRLVCERLGQACDLVVPGVASDEVAEFVRRELDFDRLYLYGAERPLHVSWGPAPVRMVVAMVRTAGGRLVPRVVRPTTSLPAQQVVEVASDDSI